MTCPAPAGQMEPPSAPWARPSKEFFMLYQDKYVAFIDMLGFLRSPNWWSSIWVLRGAPRSSPFGWEWHCSPS